MPGRVASREQAEPPQVHPSTYAARVAGQTGGGRGRRRAPLGAAARPVDLGRLRRPCRAQWRGLGRLLVHGVPPRGAAPGTRSPPGREAGAGRVGRRSRRPRVCRRRLRGVVPVRPARELPRIKHRRGYEQGAGADPSAGLADHLFFVDKATRRRGVSAAALDGALDLVSGLGGGVVESFPRPPRGGRSPRRSCTTAPWRSSRAGASNGSARWARTTGWCASPCPAGAAEALPPRSAQPAAASGSRPRRRAPHCCGRRRR